MRLSPQSWQRAQKATGEDPALQVGAELALHIPRKLSLGGARTFDERLEMLRHHLIQRFGFRGTPSIASRTGMCKESRHGRRNVATGVPCSSEAPNCHQEWMLGRSWCSLHRYECEHLLQFSVSNCTRYAIAFVAAPATTA